MLRQCISWAEEHEEQAERVPVEAFVDIQRKMSAGRELTDKQILWVRGVHEKVFDAPTYENLWSAGKVPRGEKLATPVPEVLKKPLPLKPPPRKVSE